MKILFFDIDGTLVGKDKKISDKVIHALKRTREKGNLIFLCTGRSRNYIQHFLHIGFDGYISNAGAYIVCHDKEIKTYFIHPDTVKIVDDVFNQYDVVYDHECIDHDYIKPKMITNLFSSQKDIDQFLKDYHNLLPAEKYQNEPVLKISYSCDNYEQLNKISEKLSDYFTITVNPSFSKLTGDLLYQDVNKGQAIKTVVDYLGMSLKDTIGFGDSANDLEMLRTCNESVVMGNASDEIKKYASTICESVEEDGIYYELERRNLL